MSTQAMLLYMLVETIILGAILIILPRIGRRGLLFGVYVGEARSMGEEAERLRREWTRGMAILVVAALVVGMGLEAALANPVLMPLSSGLLVLGFFVLYFRSYGRARRLAADAPPPAAAPFQSGPAPSAGIAPLVVLVVGLSGGLLALGYAWSHYPLLPERIPVHFGLDGRPDGWAPRSAASVMFLPFLTLAMGIVFGVLTYFVAHAKRALRYADDGTSLAAQDRFRRMMCRFLATLGVLVTTMLTLGSISSIRVAMGEAGALSALFLALGVGVAVTAFGGVLYIAVRYGQGGARLERAAASAPLTNGLADNRFWHLGMFYVNRDDPSIMVEHRFGLGYTINLGNWKGVLLLAGILVGTLGAGLVGMWAARG